MLSAHRGCTAVSLVNDNDMHIKSKYGLIEGQRYCKRIRGREEGIEVDTGVVLTKRGLPVQRKRAVAGMV